ncbi:bifunctional UDP-N-acetylglucosamine diphosphorylase/glucosamine-1-phosphate N-acetyltransferase GlmU [Oceanidesulfovibrio indonesiensis]|nr:bifunctional UDP-N-acetylglucosamine diphosphorylase/glucosamine-1-phosphate N-acetyltransferase GlmU [Oceanidesulfovibrio indonesiensis]
MKNAASSMEPLDEKWGAVVLAAGKGTRMHSPKPKVLMEMLGEPMLAYVLDTLEPLFSSRIFVVVGHEAESVRTRFEDRSCTFVHQAEQLGTGHALQAAWDDLAAAGIEKLLVINGDTPLVTTRDVASFVERGANAHLAFLTVSLLDPGAFGHVVRQEGRVRAIIEARDYDRDTYGPATGEINAGLYCMNMRSVEPLLGKLTAENAGGEYYITDLVGHGLEAGLQVEGVPAAAARTSGDGDVLRLLGINSPRELVRAETHLRESIVDALLGAGALLRSPEQLRVGPHVVVEPGAEIVGPCEIYGRSVIESRARVESHCVVTESRVEKGAVIHSFSHLQGAHVGPMCSVGPYARLRPGAILQEKAKVGNFVEVKKATLGPGAKASHLTYLGDAEIGADVNIGAGTITCNYDGKRKHVTRIEHDVFVGSNTALVAPVTVGAHALIAAGSVITQDVPENALAVARSRQTVLKNRGNRPDDEAS